MARIAIRPPRIRILVTPVCLVVLAAAVAACAAGPAASPAASLAASTPGAGQPGADKVVGAPEPNVAISNPGVPTTVDRATVTGGGTSGSAGVSLAYPYPGYAGSAGVGPEKTIVAVGTGHTEMKVDASDKVAAEQKAAGTALADAKAQAQAVAAAMGVTITGVYSVAVSTSQQDTYPVPASCAVPPVEPNAAASANPVRATIGPCLKTDPPQPTSSQLYVSVTVAYSFS